MDKMSEEFEKWWLQLNYGAECKDEMWEAWKASRECRLELPHNPRPIHAGSEWIKSEGRDEYKAICERYLKGKGFNVK